MGGGGLELEVEGGGEEAGEEFGAGWGWVHECVVGYI